MPDFDIDFCMEKRDKVIEYVSNKYGSNSEYSDVLGRFGNVFAGSKKKIK